MIIITSGKTYIDIDGLACCIAYKELLTLQGKEAIIYLTESLNESIPNFLIKEKLDFVSEYKKLPNKTYEYIAMDISNENYLPEHVDKNSLIKIYDHRFGFEDFWKKKLGTNAVIEPVGACATLIWEEIKKEKKQRKISNIAASLLYFAILSNTLNLKSSVTTKRDIKALKEIEKLFKIPKDSSGKYFKEVTQAIYKNPKKALENDIKEANVKGEEYFITQLELWKSKDFIKQNLNLIKKHLKQKLSFFTTPSISEGVTYIITYNPRIKDELVRSIKVRFHGELGKTKKLWLRKEVIKELNLLK